MKENLKAVLNTHNTSLGIELGSTRIKVVLIDNKADVIATGYHDWENQLVDGVWTYALEDVWSGIQSAYGHLKANVRKEYDVTLTTFGSIGVSAMMHGYLAFNIKDELLVPFRTWRNAMTQNAEVELTELLDHNIPQRWSIAHLYEAMLKKEAHLADIHHFTTLAGYVHYMLTDEKVLGIGDASGMFPIDSEKLNYDQNRIQLFNAKARSMNYTFNLEDLLPQVLNAGENAGVLRLDRIHLLDVENDLVPGIKFAPPEGDAGTGMVATNAILENTGNISAGTSVFAMIVLEKALSKVYREIDIVTTPVGAQVAMVHVNNCTTEINSWVKLFGEVATLFGETPDTDALYQKLFNEALKADEDLTNILVYGYHSGENITDIAEGRPLLVRQPDANFSLKNLMRAILDSAFATLSIGLDILVSEGVALESIVGHGGIFKTEGVAERVVAAAVKSPVSLMETANEGGAWGMAILAQYVLHSEEYSLVEYLEEVVFKEASIRTYEPTRAEVEQFEKYVQVYKDNMKIEHTAQSFI